MIKLKNIITESLKNMVFSKTMKPRHKKRMEQKVTLFPENPKLTIKPQSTIHNDINRVCFVFLL